MMKALQKKRKGGFTLIELIVVIAILGILAAIAVPRFTGFRADASERAAIAEAKNIYSSLVALEADGVTVDATVDETTAGLLALTGPIDGTLVVTDVDSFVYTAASGWDVTYTNAVVTTTAP